MSFRKFRQKLGSRGSAARAEGGSSSAALRDLLGYEASRPNHATSTDQPVQPVQPAQPAQSLQDTPSHVEPPVAFLDRDTRICELWNIAYRKLREEDEALVLDYEKKLCGDLHVGLGSILGARVLGRREQMEAVLQRKMDEINRETWKLRFGTTEIMVKDLAQTVLGIINRVNGYITGAVASNPYASLALSLIHI